ncbi:MAG: NAD(P)/FAD-dependent oxidoreductase [Thermodesulfobacteriota bacterium]
MKEEAATIIGAGPAGIAAAIQLARSGIDPLVVEKERVGGLLKNAHWVENYPGFPDGIAGLDLVSRFERQLASHVPEVLFEEVTNVGLDGHAFCVATEAKRWRARIVIVASGTKPRKDSDVAVCPGAEERIFYEIYPLHAVVGKRIAIVGAGDAAYDYALNLGKRNDILILSRSATARCLPLLRERAARAPRITVRDESRVRRVAAGSEGLDIGSACRGEERFDHADFLVFAIGREPQSDFLSETVRQQQAELERSGRLFHIGDVHNGLFRQTAIAVGDGIKAAMRIITHQEGNDR